MGIFINRIVLKTALRRNKNKNYKIKISFNSPDGPKARANKTCVNLMIFVVIFVENFNNTMLYMTSKSG